SPARCCASRRTTTAADRGRTPQENRPMSFNPRHALAAAVLASLVMAGCNRNDAEVDTTADSGVNPPAANEPVTPLPPAEPFPNTGTTPGADTALDVSSVTLGTAAGADLSITNPT